MHGGRELTWEPWMTERWSDDLMKDLVGEVRAKVILGVQVSIRLHSEKLVQESHGQETPISNWSDLKFCRGGCGYG